VLKVLGVSSGNRPMVYLKRAQQSKLCDLFKNDKGGTIISRGTEVLKNYVDTYEALVVQSFCLIALVTVLCPATTNLVKCDYLVILINRNEIDKYMLLAGIYHGTRFIRI
jgi:hypothetical protein